MPYNVNQNNTTVDDGEYIANISEILEPTDERNYFFVKVDAETDDGDCELLYFVNNRWPRKDIFVKYAASVGVSPDTDGSLAWEELVDNKVLITVANEQKSGDVRSKIVSFKAYTPDAFDTDNDLA